MGLGTGRASDRKRGRVSPQGWQTRSLPQATSQLAEGMRRLRELGGGLVQTACNQAQPGPLSGEVLLRAGTSISPAAGPGPTEALPHILGTGAPQGRTDPDQERSQPCSQVRGRAAFPEGDYQKAFYSAQCHLGEGQGKGEVHPSGTRRSGPQPPSGRLGGTGLTGGRDSVTGAHESPA